MFNHLLDWARGDSNYRMVAHGWLLRDSWDHNQVLEPWQRMYINNILEARSKGISA